MNTAVTGAGFKIIEKSDLVLKGPLGMRHF